MKFNKTNLSVVDNAGVRVQPRIVIGDQGDYRSGDILDANAVQNIVKTDGDVDYAEYSQFKEDTESSISDINTAIQGVEDDVADISDKVDKLTVGFNPSVGDVLFTDGTISADVETEIDSGKTPIAVCVAPASEFDDNKARFASLKFAHNGSSWCISAVSYEDTPLKNISSDEYVKTDYNGSENTDILIDFGGNQYSAAYLCKIYNPGAYYNEWYLPACGELYYMYTNYDKISDTIDKIYAKDQSLVDDIYSHTYWSSSEYSQIEAWCVYLNTRSFFGGVSYSSKSSYDTILPFVVIPPINTPTEEIKIKTEEIKTNNESLEEATAKSIAILNKKITSVFMRIDDIDKRVNDLENA